MPVEEILSLQAAEPSRGSLVEVPVMRPERFRDFDRLTGLLTSCVMMCLGSLRDRRVKSNQMPKLCTANTGNHPNLFVEFSESMKEDKSIVGTSLESRVKASAIQ
jgi:hypothetical protein